MDGRRARRHQLQPSAPLDGSRLRAQAGESLIELLATITIVGICIVGMVGALGVNFLFSASNNTNSHGHQVLVRYAEALAAEAYQPCVQNGPRPYLAAEAADRPSANLPDGVAVGAPGGVAATPYAFALSVESVQYWNHDSAPATFGSACPASDPGYQQIVVKGQSGDGTFLERIAIFKRAP